MRFKAKIKCHTISFLFAIVQTKEGWWYWNKIRVHSFILFPQKRSFWKTCFDDYPRGSLLGRGEKKTSTNRGLSFPVLDLSFSLDFLFLFLPLLLPLWRKKERSTSKALLAGLTWWRKLARHKKHPKPKTQKNWEKNKNPQKAGEGLACILLYTICFVLF